MTEGSSFGRAVALSALSVVGPLGLLAALAPVLPVSQNVGAVLSFATVSAVIVLSVSLAPLKTIAPPRSAALAVVAGVALSALSLKLPPTLSGLLGSLGVVTCGMALGASVGIRVAAPGHLMVVAMLSAAVDLWSVTAPSGVTHAIVGNPMMLQLLTVRAAVPHMEGPHPTIGFGDVVFAALYTASCTRFGMARWRTAAALVAGLLGAGAAALALGAEGGIPALPFMGAAVVAMQPATRTIAPKDRPAAGFVVLVLVAALVHLALRWRP